MSLNQKIRWWVAVRFNILLCKTHIKICRSYLIYRVDARLPVGFTTRVWLLPKPTRNYREFGSGTQISVVRASESDSREWLEEAPVCQALGKYNILHAAVIKAGKA
ncbi:hypothetical protein [Rubritalea tangerina]|uniref:hypothetical protein n=1 Tax=Rubritalea tangerina TaxID=430798 RepID=UPI003609486D